MTNNVNQNKIEGLEGEFFHPSFDIRNGILILGFRYLGKKGEEKEIFLIVKKGEIEICSDNSFEFEGKKYFIEKKGRKLARLEERWSLQKLNEFLERYQKGEALPTLKEVYGEIKELCKKYIEAGKEVDYSLITAWIIGIYFFPIFSACPFLNIKAPKRSGKSQCLNFLRQICFNAIKARPSLPALADTVDSLKGVYLIDQADSLRRRGNEDLVDILADSYKKGGGKRRIMIREKRESGWKPEEFETYAPKVFASVGELPEDLRDRCLIIPLVRSQKNFPEPDEEAENWRDIRGKCYEVLINNYTIIENTYNVRKVNYRMKPEVVGRELELWLPLKIIFELSAPEELRGAKKRFQQLYGFSEYEPSEFEEAVIRTILGLFSDASEIILSPKKISENMNEEAFSPQENPQQRAVRVGWTIRKFHLASEKRPRTKEGVSYLFKKEKVEKIYKSYFPLINNSTSPTSTPENELNLDDVGG